MTVGERDRLQQLVQAGIALSSQLSLDSLLQLVAETAAAVTGARYAALGVVDATGPGLERFVTVGIPEEERARIGEPPRDHEVLGVLIGEADALRLRELGDDPSPADFPAGRPGAKSFLGVPLQLRGTAYGNLYLTGKEGGGEFSEDDEELVAVLASQAAVAIENARLYESATRALAERQSLDRIANELVREPDLHRLLELISASLRELVDARLVAVWLAGAEGQPRLEAVSGDAGELASDTAWSRSEKLLGILERGRTERLDSVIGDPEIDQQDARRLGITSGLWAPLLVRGGALGVIAAFDRNGPGKRFTDHDVRVAEAIADRAAVAVELRQRLSRDAVRAMLRAQERERKRIGRELHDQTGQALTSILLALKQHEEQLGAETLEPLRRLVRSALADVRRLAVELRPAILDDFGVRAALERLTRLPEGAPAVRFETNLGDVERLPEEHETTLYRIVQETLTNTLEHAHATHVRVQLQGDDGEVTLLVEDDGDGFAPDRVGAGHYGLAGIRERVDLLDGTLSLTSAPGNGTVLRVRLPLGHRARADEDALSRA